MRNENILNLAKTISCSKIKGDRKIKYVSVLNGSRVKIQIVNSMMITTSVVSNLCIDDIVICKLPNINKVYLINQYTKNYIFSNDFLVLRCYNTEIARYLYYYFLTEEFNIQKNQLCKGITKQRLQLNSLKNMNIPMYDTLMNNIKNIDKINEEHKKKTIEENRILKAIIEKKDNLFCKVFNRNLYESLSNEFYELKKIGDVLKCITVGSKKNLKIEDSGVRYITRRNIVNNKLDFKDTKYISEENNKYLRYVCNPQINDCVIDVMTGESVILDIEEEVNFDNSLMLLQHNEEVILPQYLFLLLKSRNMRNMFKSLLKPLNVEDISKIQIPLYSLDVQKQIIDIVSIEEEGLDKCMMEITQQYNKRRNDLITFISQCCK